MKPKPLRPIHCIGFFLYAFGHVTDGEITYEEKEQIITQLKIWSPEDVCPDFNALIAEIVEWYADVYDSGQAEMQKMVWYCAGSIKEFFDAQLPAAAEIVIKQFLDALVEIAKVDGEIKQSEKAWLNAICEIFEVDFPII
jgi:tellurite resistance protein|tara:strand:+ start:105 stop:524 length:420 start_codon:yes stop_codon:yes gene_type:complete